MARIRFDGVSKVFPNGVAAVRDLHLDIDDGEFMILVGPSGCGKTTALRMIAGFEKPTSGSILMDETIVNDMDPGDRDVAMIFQNYALFPHMTARKNLAFPLRMRGYPKQEITQRVDEAAEMLGLRELLDRLPSELSGGQRQRVAMGRAIVRHPAVFLMDEPLSNLDAKLRSQMRAELARLHQRLGVTTLYVTHDQTEAMTLGTQVAVMRDGLLQQVGPPRLLYRFPANLFVARFLGSPPMNLFVGRFDDGYLTLAGSDGQPTQIGQKFSTVDREVVVGIRPEAWRERSRTPSREICLQVTIEVVEDFGDEIVVHVAHVGDERPALATNEDGDEVTTFTARLTPRDDIVPGERLTLHADIDSIHLFDPDTGRSLLVDAQSEPRNETETDIP